MADNVWLDVDGNWNNTANWSLGAVPVSTNNVFIPNGVQNITQGLNQAAVALASLRIGPGFSGSIGSDQGSLIIGATAVDVAGSGQEYWLQPQGTWATVDITAASGGADAVHFTGTGTITLARLIGPLVAGTITFANSLRLDAIDQKNCPAARVVVGTHGSLALVTVKKDAGDLEVARNVTTLENLGGTGRNTGTAAIATYRDAANASWNYDSSGTLATACDVSGLLDFSENKTAAIVVTPQIQLFPTGHVNFQSGLNNVSATVLYKGGRITFDIGKVISMA